LRRNIQVRLTPQGCRGASPGSWREAFFEQSEKNDFFRKMLNCRWVPGNITDGQGETGEPHIRRRWQGGDSLYRTLKKDLYPSYRFTKAHIILEYYRRIAPFIPSPFERPGIDLWKRYPEGVEKDSFSRSVGPSHRPAWVKTAEIPQEDGSG